MMISKDIFLSFVVLAVCSSVCSSAAGDLPSLRGADGDSSYGPVDSAVDGRLGLERRLKSDKAMKKSKVGKSESPTDPSKSTKKSSKKKNSKTSTPVTSPPTDPPTPNPTPAPVFTVVRVYDASCTVDAANCDAAGVAAANELAFIAELCDAGINANGECPSGGGRDDTVVEVAVSAAGKPCVPVDATKNCFNVEVQSASTSESSANASADAGDQAVADGSIADKVSVEVGGYEDDAPDVTLSPTENPSPAPTTSPTQAPTNPPTTSPTESPTASPTPEPTEGDTDEPSEVPSEAPSVTAPTPATPPPVATPSPTDSQYPSKDPTGMPTESFKPTA